MIVLVDIEDARDEIGYLPGMIDIDHVEAHFLGEHGVVLGDLLHLGEKGAREGFHLVGVLLLLVQVVHRRHDGRFL